MDEITAVEALRLRIKKSPEFRAGRFFTLISVISVLVIILGDENANFKCKFGVVFPLFAAFIKEGSVYAVLDKMRDDWTYWKIVLMGTFCYEFIVYILLSGAPCQLEVSVFMIVMVLSPVPFDLVMLRHSPLARYCGTHNHEIELV